MVSWINELGSTPIPFATLNNVRRLGPWMPRSSSLINVRLSPVDKNKPIWDIFLRFRALRMASPNALSTPSRG